MMPDKNELAEARLALAGADMAGMALVRENERLREEREHLIEAASQLQTRLDAALVDTGVVADHEQIFAQGRAENERLRGALHIIRDHYKVHTGTGGACCLTCDQIAQDGLATSPRPSPRV
jgi:regulator of replication initiation timing